MAPGLQPAGTQIQTGGNRHLNEPPNAPPGLARELAQALNLETGADGAILINTPFAYADGDQPVIAATPDENGNWLLTDQGNARFRLGMQLNDDEYKNPANRQRLDSIVTMAGAESRQGELVKKLPRHGQQADAVFDFVHMLLKIDELGDYPSRGANQRIQNNKNHQSAPDKILNRIRDLANPQLPNLSMARRTIATNALHSIADCVATMNEMPPGTDQYAPEPVMLWTAVRDNARLLATAVNAAGDELSSLTNLLLKETKPPTY